MKRQDVKKLHHLSATELMTKASSLRKDLAQSLLKRHANQEKDVHKAKKIRTELTQTLTILKEKELTTPTSPATSTTKKEK